MEKGKLVEINEGLNNNEFVNIENLFEDNNIDCVIIPKFEVGFFWKDRVYVYQKDEKRAIQLLKNYGYFEEKVKDLSELNTHRDLSYSIYIGLWIGLGLLFVVVFYFLLAYFFEWQCGY